MPSPLVSIIVVSYNQGKYIRENLNSIKDQTYKNLELILADDASSDNSVEIFEKWLEENAISAKKIYHSHNTGLATILNECLELVTGKYVKMIAADDYLHPASIQKCVMKLERLGEEYGMVFTNIHTIDEQSNIISPYLVNNENIFEKNTLRYEALIEKNRIIAPSTIVKTQAIKETGKYKDNFILEDYDRWLRIGKEKKIYYINEKLCYYRRHETNISQIKHRQMFFEDLYLKMIHDKSGLKKTYVNKSMGEIFMKKEEVIPKMVKDAYFKYPYKGKMLSLCIRYNLFRIYKTFFNILYK